MLGKLMKYEFRATRRIFLPLYGLILVFAAINRFFLRSSGSYQQGDPYSLKIISDISMLIYVLLIAAAGVVTLVVLIQRFQKNLLADEGYLSFTLPVKVHSHISCKMLVTLVWMLLSIITAALSVVILSIDETFLRNVQDFFSQLGQAFTEYGGQAYLILFECIVLLIVGILGSTLQIYAAVTVGNYSSKHKLLAGFGVYLGFSVVEQYLGTVIFGRNISIGSFLFGTFRLYEDTAPMLNRVSNILLASICFTAVFAAAYYFLTNWLLSRKLNLE